MALAEQTLLCPYTTGFVDIDLLKSHKDNLLITVLFSLKL
jgi:hypothetical protein